MDQGDAEISREIVFRLVGACQESGRDELEVAKLRELCEQSGVPLGATSGILELILPPDDTSGKLPWKHFVVALCAQVGGVEDVTGFVRLLLDPGMFGNDDGQISKSEFADLFDWWSSIDTSISAELKSGLFAALEVSEDEVSNTDACDVNRIFLFALVTGFCATPATSSSYALHWLESKTGANCSRALATPC